jgi:hypothetical protein
MRSFGSMTCLMNLHTQDKNFFAKVGFALKFFFVTNVRCN